MTLIRAPVPNPLPSRTRQPGHRQSADGVRVCVCARARAHARMRPERTHSWHIAVHLRYRSLNVLPLHPSLSTLP